MGTVKIGEWIDKTCQHPNHYPKTKDIQGPGIYRHTCPQCEAEIEFTNIHANIRQELMSIVLESAQFKEGKPWPWK